MNWMLASAMKNVLSLIPAGEQLNYFSQRHILKTVPIDDDSFQQKRLILADNTLTLLLNINPSI